MTETVVQTVKLELETSDRKNQKIQTAINEYQRMTEYFSDVIVSFDENQWTTMNPQYYRIGKDKFDDRETNANTLLEAIEDVIGAYNSWKSNGKDGERPQFGNNSYFNVKSANVDVEKSNGKYGIRLNFIPYNAEWFGIKTTPYNEKYLERIVIDDSEVGTCEVHKDGESVTAHLVVKWEEEVIDFEDVQKYVGVDIGENVIYSLSVVSDEVEEVNLKSGKEFRHHRERLKEKRKGLMEKDDLRGVRKCSGEHERYTESVLDSSSKEIVDIASKHENAGIVLEDLTHYRNTAQNAIHDWPFALLQEKIMYKAKEQGIPVKTVKPDYTSETCRKCGFQSTSNRNGSEFQCGECGYEVHADVNASLNIALRGADDLCRENLLCS